MAKKIIFLFLFIIPILVAGFFFLIGYIFGPGIVFGPYAMDKYKGNVYLEFPYKNEKGYISDYNTVNLYEDINNDGKLSPRKCSGVYCIYGEELKWDVSFDEFAKIVENKDHPQKKEFLIKLGFCKIAHYAYGWYGRIKYKWFLISGLIVFAGLFFTRQSLLFLALWFVYTSAWVACQVFLVAPWAGVPELIKFDPYHYRHYEILDYTAKALLPDNLWSRLPLTLMWFLSPVVLFFAAVIYLLKHWFPRRQREVEDFLKVDKDKKKREELNIEQVTFKKFPYNLRAKLELYRQANAYFLGVDDNGKDITVAENMMNMHLHILGSSGAGKTSQVVSPLAWQVLEKGRGGLFIDFKGDDMFRKIVKQKAVEAGKRFYYFSIDPHEKSCNYNPLSSGSVDSKVDRIMSALELIFKGEASFYSNIQTLAFTKVLKQIKASKGKITFKTVHDTLDNETFLNAAGIRKEHVQGLTAVISRFADCRILNVKGVDLGKIIKNGDTVFFALKSSVNTQLAEAIGRMLIIDLKYQAAFRKETDPNFYIFIDEFQNLSTTHFLDVISKVRSANFCLVLSNQSRGNLQAVSASFENTIFENTAIKVIFTQENPEDARFWSDKTGNTTYENRGMSQFDGTGVDGEKTILDGRRSAQGYISRQFKNYISDNIFLRLPFLKSVIFTRNELARIANHEFLFSKDERDDILRQDFKGENKFFRLPLAFWKKICYIVNRFFHKGKF